LKYCTKVLPGRPGTKKLLALYGAKLLCVRYRYDDLLGRRAKTVELLIDSAPWTPRQPAPPVVQIRTNPRETRLHAVILQSGGLWNPRLAVWTLPPAVALELGLSDRVVHRTRHPRRLSAIRKNGAASDSKTHSR
jgi:hypothetical protein